MHFLTWTCKENSLRRLGFMGGDGLNEWIIQVTQAMHMDVD